MCRAQANSHPADKGSTRLLRRGSHPPPAQRHQPAHMSRLATSPGPRVTGWVPPAVTLQCAGHPSPYPASGPPFPSWGEILRALEKNSSLLSLQRGDGSLGRLGMQADRWSGLLPGLGPVGSTGGGDGQGDQPSPLDGQLSQLLTGLSGNPGREDASPKAPPQHHGG